MDTRRRSPRPPAAAARAATQLAVVRHGRRAGDHRSRAERARLPHPLGGPRGDGHPVLVLPGLGAGDWSTIVLRRTLHHLGYAVHGWDLGRNRGPTADVIEQVPQRVASLADRFERRVSLVGWSLGGIYAYAAARTHPGLVRQVITLGSPVRMTHPAQTRAMAYYRWNAHRHVPERLLPPSEWDQPPLKMPATSILSRCDGIVAYRASMLPPGANRANIAVMSSHFGLGQHPAVLWAVADRLAQPEDDWRPFRPPLMLRMLFPTLPELAGEAVRTR